MRSMWMLLLALGVAVPVSGCDQLTGDKKKTEKKDEDDDSDKKKKKKKASEESEETEEEEASAKPTATAAPTPPPVPTPTATATATDAAPTATGTTPPTPTQPTLPGRSAVPSNDEWNAAPEISVSGSTRLGCETKGVREWVRVTCRGNDASRGAPTGASISRGGGKGDTFVFSSGGVASIVYPFYEGQELVARFTWERHTSNFTAGWAQGAPKPPVYGIFANQNVAVPTTTTTTTVPTATATVTTTATATATATATTKPTCKSDADCKPGTKCKPSSSGAMVCVRSR